MNEQTPTPDADKPAARAPRAAKESPTPERKMRRVVIHRPEGVTDTHKHLGFNSFEAHVPYGEPVELPADMVEYLKKQRKPVFSPNEKGEVTVQWVGTLAIADAD